MPPNGAQSLRFNMLYQFLPKLNPKFPLIFCSLLKLCSMQSAMEVPALPLQLNYPPVGLVTGLSDLYGCATTLKTLRTQPEILCVY